MERKARLDKASEHQALFTTWRIAKMIHGHELELAAPVRLTTEDPRFPQWDDVVEERADVCGSSFDAWQVKRQSTPLDAESISRLLQALESRSELSGHFALLELVEVKDIGPLRLLRELCDDVRAQGSGSATRLPSLQGCPRRWLDAVRAALSEPGAAANVLARLFIEQLPDARDLRERTVELLAALFDRPREVFDALHADVSAHRSPGAAFDYETVTARVLTRFEESRRRHPSGALGRLRSEYLNYVVENANRLRPLHGLMETSSAVLLSDVYIAPRVSVWSPAPLNFEPPPEEIRKGNRPPPDEKQRDRDDPVQRSMPLHAYLEGARARSAKAILLLAEMGRGKSTALEMLAAAFAIQALGQPDAPVPVHLSAGALCGASIDDAAAARVPIPATRRLLNAFPPPRRIFLIDGLDEVPEAGLREVSDKLDVIATAPDTALLMVTSRPTTRDLHLRTTIERVHLEAWDQAAVQDFILRWRRVESRRADALDETRSHPGIDELLANPLTAAFCMELAEDGPAALRSRPEVFRAIVARLFQRWHRARGTGSATRWVEVAPALQSLALRALRAGESIRRNDLERLAAIVSPEDEFVLLDHGSRVFGLLTRNPDGNYRFVLRSIGEYLAAHALLKEGDASVGAGADEGWSEEIARHAMGLRLKESGGPQGVLSLVHPVAIERKNSVGGLRRLLVACRAASDVGDHPPDLASTLAEALWTRLTDPTSEWVSERAAEVLEWVARGDTPLWRALWERIRESLFGVRMNRAGWLAAHGADDWTKVVPFLHEQDEGVRRVAVSLLAGWVGHPDVQKKLVYELVDTGKSITDGPALHAALLLRTCPRGDLAVETVKRLKALVRSRQQIPSGAAAIALLPGEAPPEDLAVALRELNTGIRFSRSIVEELAANSDGAAALEREWPQWRSANFEEPRTTTPVERPSPLPRCRMASHCESNIIRSLWPAMERLPREEHDALVTAAKRGSFSAILAVTRAGATEPSVLKAVLASEHSFWGPQARDALGQAALRHTCIRDQLIEMWQAAADDNARDRVPVSALDACVAAGDNEAAEVFAAWLEHHGTRYFPWQDGPAAAAVAHPRVAPAALRAAREVWRFACLGKIEDGKQSRLAPQTAGPMLRYLRPAWETDDQIRSGLLAWAHRGDDYEFGCVLAAFGDAPAPGEVIDCLEARLLRFLEDAAADRWLMESWIGWADKAGLASRFSPILLRLLSEGACPAPQRVAAMLCSVSAPETGREISAALASVWPKGRGLGTGRTVLERLVWSAPDVWTSVLLQHLPVVRTLLFEGDPLLLLARVVLMTTLDAHERQRIAEAVLLHVGSMELPWFFGTRGFGDQYRAADEARKVLFEAGMKLPVAGE